MIGLLGLADGYTLFRLRNGSVQRLAVSKFENADEEVNMMREGRLSPNLWKFLKYCFGSEVESLAVGDGRLGNEINLRLGIQCAKRRSANRLLRIGRLQFNLLRVGGSRGPLDLSLIQRISANDMDVPLIMSMIATLDDLDPHINQLGMSLKESYGSHFPELARIVPDAGLYAKSVLLMGKRKNAANLDFDFLTEDVEDDLKAAAIVSSGVRYKALDVDASKGIATQYLTSLRERDVIRQGLTLKMNTVAPNMTGLLGARFAAQLIREVGSLSELANLPGSKIQYLGRRARPKRLSTIFRSDLLGPVLKRDKPKIARSLAAKISLAARCDFFGRGGQVNYVGTTSRQSIHDRITALKGPQG